MKRAGKIVVACVIAGAFTLAWTIYRGTGTRYTERITGVDIPSHRTDYQCQACFFAEVSFMRLSSEQVSELTNSTRFVRRDFDGPPPNADLLFESLGVGDPIPMMSEIAIHADASEGAGQPMADLAHSPIDTCRHE